MGGTGIALCALNDIAIEAKVGELADSGIPCITFNSDLPNSRRLCSSVRITRRAAASPPSC